MLIKYFEINKNSHNIRCKIYANDVKNIDKVIVFCHGFADDEVVPFDVVNRFAEKNIINFVSVKGSDHRFLNPKHMEVALKSFVEFFEIK